MIRCCFFILLFLSGNASAAPTGRQLLDACRGVVAGSAGRIDSMMCEWYIRPCNCEVGENVKIPRVCLPDGVSSETLARKVIEGMETENELAGESASYAAAVILSKTYPCNVVNKHRLKDN